MATDTGSNAASVPDTIKNELYSRVASFYGADSFEKLRGASVIVVGLGGVGSHAAHMLVRSGVSSIRLIDFDQVSLSSLNRHAVANMGDVGTPKVVAMKNKLLEIIPWCNIDAVNEMFTEEHAERLLRGNPTYVIDAIDDVNTKAQLIAFCVKRSIPVITSMGAGGKADPTKLRVGTLSDCVKDPLAAKMKWKLKKFYEIDSDAVPCIFSVEKAAVSLLPLSAEQQANPAEFGCVDNFRVRVIPVLGTSPAIFGQALAAIVLCRLSDFPLDPEYTEATSKNFRQKMRQQLEASEMRTHGTREHVSLDDDDLEFLIRQVWGSRCALSQNRLGSHHAFTLARWNPDRPPAVDNLILVTQGALTKLERWRQQQSGGGEVSAGEAKREAKRAENEKRKEAKKELKRASKAEGAVIAASTAGGGDGGEDSGSTVVSAEKPAYEPYELRPEDAERIEARLLWAKAVVAETRAELYRHPLSVEERVLMSQWFPADAEKPAGASAGGVSGASITTLLVASALSFVVGVAVSKYISRKY
jgi:tRNA threonylcarbamoyladenosine dehydratase